LNKKYGAGGAFDLPTQNTIMVITDFKDTPSSKPSSSSVPSRGEVPVGSLNGCSCKYATNHTTN
jgi:hypothetical protein